DEAVVDDDDPQDEKDDHAKDDPGGRGHGGLLAALRSGWCSASEVRESSRQSLTRTSEAKEHYQLHDSSAAFRFEVPDRVCRDCCRNFKSAALGTLPINCGLGESS